MEILFAIIVGIIGYVVKKKTEVQNREHSAPSRPNLSPNKPATSRNLERKNVIHDLKTTMEEAQPQVVETIEHALESKQDMITHAINEKTEGLSNNLKENPKNLDINENDLLKGIILSEVLGPPRAKRPYKR